MQDNPHDILYSCPLLFSGVPAEVLGWYADGLIQLQMTFLFETGELEALKN